MLSGMNSIYKFVFQKLKKTMKKIITSILTCFIISGAYAQFEQGTMLIGGDFQLSSITDKNKSGNTTVTNGKTTTFSLAPQFGYFVIDNLAVGGNLDLTLSKFKSDDDNGVTSTTTQITIGPFARYYFEPGIFVQGALGVGSAKGKSTIGSVSNESTFGVTNYSLAAGYAYFLNDHVAVEPMVGYLSTIYTEKDSDPKQKDINSGLFLSVGFQIYLGK
jgi:outer membrane protein